MSDLILSETHGPVLVLRLNRPEALNALNMALMQALAAVLADAEADAGVRCIVITGNEKAFAAGADVREMQGKSYAQALAEDMFGREVAAIARIRKPIIAAVSGYCLGGGCELAMLCDFILCSDTARFGQPEVNLGIIPGMGGSQRLTRAVGKAKAMEMVLTGRMMDAAEAERAGLVSRVIPLGDLMAEAVKAATAIAGKSALAVMAAKEAVNRAQETSLTEGLLFERRQFHAMFGTEDQKEGMAAFIAKRPARFSDS